ncbi:thiolase-like protein [Ustulina deusta]|nr:thiolase-like protein [Ustulina deusta]
MCTRRRHESYLGPDASCGPNALGSLSADSRCYAFDSRANGYAPGEGIRMLVLKHIDGSLGDGDPARAVNRGTGLNQEDKTRPTMHPTWRYTNNDAQLAALDSKDTQLAELHGAGMKASDSTEMRLLLEQFLTISEAPSITAL